MLSDSNKIEKAENIVSQKEIYTGKYISLKVLTVEKAKGYSQRECIEHPGTILLIALTEDRKLVLNKIYRKSIDEYSTELPSKRIDSNENHLDVIKNEMLEELGYEVDNIKNVYSFYPSIAYSDEKVYMYVTDVRKVKDVNVCSTFSTMEVSLDLIKERFDELGIIDAKSIVGIDYILKEFNL